MNRMRLNKLSLICAAMMSQAIAQEGSMHKDTIAVAKRSHAGLWPVIIIILVTLLAFTYLLTRAIDKRTNKH